MPPVAPQKRYPYDEPAGQVDRVRTRHRELGPHGEATKGFIRLSIWNRHPEPPADRAVWRGARR